jgi:hypothetical protein
MRGVKTYPLRKEKDAGAGRVGLRVTLADSGTSAIPSLAEGRRSEPSRGRLALSRSWAHLNPRSQRIANYAASRQRVTSSRRIVHIGRLHRETATFRCWMGPEYRAQEL